MMAAPQKTPISVLNELAIKNKLEVSGQCIEDPMCPPTAESVRTSPIFRYEYMCNSYIARGEGTSKKRAQHNAAERMIAILKTSPEFGSAFGDKITLSSPSEIKVEKDAVGPLTDFCAEYSLPIPEYHTVREEGPAHDRRFTSRCSIPSYAVEATDRQKKQAKQQVALKMLIMLRDTIEPRVNKVIDLYTIANDKRSNDFNKILETFPNCGRTFNNKYQAKDLSSPLLTDFLRYQNYHQKVTEVFDELTPLETLNLEEALDFVLQKIEIPYSVIPVANEHNCLVILNIQFAPDLNVSEMGRTYIEASHGAARKALEYIRILCSPTPEENEETPIPQDVRNDVLSESS